jgi:hypothetical protein
VNEFGMKIVKTTRTAFKRQILESVTIQKGRRHNLMNNKSEYNRCALPRLTARLGEKDLEKWREGDREEMEKEATIEEKIRLRKKKRSRKRAEQTRRRELGQPKKKKMRLDKECAEEKKEEENREIRTTPPKKRKVASSEKMHPAKKRRENQMMRKYITCKKWNEEREEGTDQQGLYGDGEREQHDDKTTTSSEEGQGLTATPPATTPTRSLQTQR